MSGVVEHAMWLGSTTSTVLQPDIAPVLQQPGSHPPGITPSLYLNIGLQPENIMHSPWCGPVDPFWVMAASRARGVSNLGTAYRYSTFNICFVGLGPLEEMDPMYYA